MMPEIVHVASSKLPMALSISPECHMQANGLLKSKMGGLPSVAVDHLALSYFQVAQKARVMEGSNSDSAVSPLDQGAHLQGALSLHAELNDDQAISVRLVCNQAP